MKYPCRRLLQSQRWRWHRRERLSENPRLMLSSAFPPHPGSVAIEHDEDQRQLRPFGGTGPASALCVRPSAAASWGTGMGSGLGSGSGHGTGLDCRLQPILPILSQRGGARLSDAVFFSSGAASVEGRGDASKKDEVPVPEDGVPGSARPPESDGERMRSSAKEGVGKVRVLFRQYGAVFVGTYTTVYVATVASLFVAVNWGFIDPSSITFGSGGEDVMSLGADLDLDVDTALGGEGSAAESHDNPPHTKRKKPSLAAVEFLERFEWSRKWAEAAERNPSVINFGLAWFATKFTEPLRLGLTIAITPRVARFFGRAPAPLPANSSDGPAAEENVK